MYRLAATSEIVASIYTDGIDAQDLEAFKADPHGFLLATTNVKFEDGIRFGFVENNAKTMHLTLPYYSEVENIESVTLPDAEMQEVVGGEIAGIILALVTFFGGIGGAIGLGAGTTAAASVGAIVGGVAVVAGGATAAAAGTAGAATGIAAGAQAAQGKHINGKKK